MQRTKLTRSVQASRTSKMCYQSLNFKTQSISKKFLVATIQTKTLKVSGIETTHRWWSASKTWWQVLNTRWARPQRQLLRSRTRLQVVVSRKRQRPILTWDADKEVMIHPSRQEWEISIIQVLIQTIIELKSCPLRFYRNPEKANSMLQTDTRFKDDKDRGWKEACHILRHIKTIQASLKMNSLFQVLKDKDLASRSIDTT